MPTGNDYVTQSQIDSFAERMVQGFDELKNMVRPLDERLRAIERMEAGCYPVTVTRIDAVVKQLSDHETKIAAKSQQINKLEQQVSKLAGMYNFFIFISSAFGLSLIALIWALITGQAHIVFK